MGSHVDEETRSTSSGEVLSHAYASGVKMWLRPVRESKADAL